MESSSGRRLSAFHALSRRDDVNSLEQTLGKGSMAIYCPGAAKSLSWEIPEGRGALPPLSNVWGRKWMGGRVYSPLARSLGCKVSKHSQEGSKGNFLSNPDVGSCPTRQAGQPALGESFKHELKGHKGRTEMPGLGFGFLFLLLLSPTLLQVAPTTPQVAG